MMSQSEEAYRRFVLSDKPQSKSMIARDMNISRKTIATWIKKEAQKREKALQILRSMKNILESV